MGCNFAHPVKTDKVVEESELFGTWTYRDEIKITLTDGGSGIQIQDGIEHKFNWRLTSDNHIELLSVRLKQNSSDVDDFKFIVSDDYREHFYFFGGFSDFDNYEIWEKSADDNS